MRLFSQFLSSFSPSPNQAALSLQGKCWSDAFRNSGFGHYYPSASSSKTQITCRSGRSGWWVGKKKEKTLLRVTQTAISLTPFAMELSSTIQFSEAIGKKGILILFSFIR
jgi:hypothetical protein